jgi:lipid-A-disaccharide synthase
MKEGGTETVLISVGEFSGELLAGDLVGALREKNPSLRFFGAGGTRLAAAGVEIVADYAGLDVMAYIEIISKINEFKTHLSSLLTAVDRRRPALAILVDYPGMHFMLGEQLALRQIPVVQYIAPKLWAWGKGRTIKLRRDFRLVLGMLPFEEEFFHAHQVPFAYIGSPLRDRADEIAARIPAQSQEERKNFSCSGYSPLLGFLPGSRRDEIKHILPLLPELNRELKKYFPRLGWVLPIADSVDRNLINSYLPAGENSNVVLIAGHSLEVMRSADACVVASGTATLECALVGTPLLAVYRMSELNYRMAKRVVKLRWISLVNLVLQKRAIAEFVQDFTLSELVAEVRALLGDSECRKKFFADVAELQRVLTPGAARCAAEKILALLG